MRRASRSSRGCRVLGAGVNFFNAGDIILGGDGSDLIQGNAGDDIIDGDKWLNVRIGIMSGFNANGPTGAEDVEPNGAAQEIKSMTSPVTLRLDAQGDDGRRPAARSITKPLSAWMFEGRINPGQLQIIREIKTRRDRGRHRHRQVPGRSRRICLLGDRRRPGHRHPRHRGLARRHRPAAQHRKGGVRGRRRAQHHRRHAVNDNGLHPGAAP